jgi:hypothetical protein
MSACGSHTTQSSECLAVHKHADQPLTLARHQTQETRGEEHDCTRVLSLRLVLVALLTRQTPVYMHIGEQLGTRCNACPSV